MACHDNFVRVAISVSDDGDDVALEGQNNFYRTNRGRDDRDESQLFQRVPGASPPSGEFHFHVQADQRNHSSKELALIVPSNLKMPNDLLAFVLLHCKLSQVSPPTLNVDTPQHGFDMSSSPESHEVAYSQHSIAREDCEVAAYDWKEEEEKKRK